MLHLYQVYMLKFENLNDLTIDLEGNTISKISC